MEILSPGLVAGSLAAEIGSALQHLGHLCQRNISRGSFGIQVTIMTYGERAEASTDPYTSPSIVDVLRLARY